MELLDELKRAICKIGETSSHTGTLIRWYKFFLPQLQQVQSAVCSPHSMRILAEETAFRTERILEEFHSTKNNIWSRYLSAVNSGELLGIEHQRYQECRKWLQLLVDESYVDEVEGPDEKSKRYAYALSGLPLPAWLQEKEILNWLEEIITANCFVWFSAMDYEDEWRNAA